MAKRVGVDKWLFGVTLMLVVIGLLMIFSYIAGWHHKARVPTATANERRVLYLGGPDASRLQV